MWDWFLGTTAVMTEEDRKEIEMNTWRGRPALAERMGDSVTGRL
jgi:hypothetical protein